MRLSNVSEPSAVEGTSSTSQRPLAGSEHLQISCRCRAPRAPSTNPFAVHSKVRYFLTEHVLSGNLGDEGFRPLARPTPMVGADPVFLHYSLKKHEPIDT